MNKIGEITLVVVGKEFDENLPIKGIVIIENPDGSKYELDVLDFIKAKWYEDIA